jgi:hypothetical protein
MGNYLNFSLDRATQLSLHVQDFVVICTDWPVPHSYCTLFNYFFPVAVRPNPGLGILIFRFLYHTHRSSTLDRTSWAIDQFVTETSLNTQHSKQTNIQAPDGIRTHNFRWRAATDLCIGPATTVNDSI